MVGGISVRDHLRLARARDVRVLADSPVSKAPISKVPLCWPCELGINMTPTIVNERIRTAERSLSYPASIASFLPSITIRSFLNLEGARADKALRKARGTYRRHADKGGVTEQAC